MFTKDRIFHSLIALAVGLFASPSFADLVHLKNGGVLEGKARRENGQVYIQMRSDGTKSVARVGFEY